MNYSEKENLILNKLQDTNYALFGNDKNEAIDCVTECLLTIVNYYTESTKTAITRFAHTSIKEQNLVAATNSIKSLNDICCKLGIEPFMDIDTTDSNVVAKTINDFVTELYNKGINKK